jgi:membrane protein implicated in regulation of membrane protease activity
MRVFAGLLAVLLFFPGACFTFFGVALASDGGWWLALIAIPIFAAVFFLGRHAYRGDTKPL